MRAWTRAALGVVVVLAAACTGSDRATERSPVGEVRIGVLAPLSGANRAAGQDALRGAQLAAALVNGEEGPVPLLGVTNTGLRGLGGPRIAIVPADTGSDPLRSPARGATQAASLVTQERVVGLVGAYDAEVTAAASQRTERLGVPFVNGDTSTGYLTERGLDWFFRSGPTDRMLGEAFFSTLRQQPGGAGRVAVLYANNAPGNLLVREIQQLATENGDAAPDAVPFTPGASSLVPAVQQVRAKQPNVLFVAASSGADATKVIRAFGALGYRPPAVYSFGTGFSEPGVIEAAGADGEGMLYSSAWSREVAARNPTAKPIMDRYEERFSAAMSEVAAGSFTAVLALAAAVDAAGSVNPQRVRAALIGLDLPGRSTIMPWSGVRFDTSSHQNARASGTVEQMVQGAFRVVFPRELAQAR